MSESMGAALRAAREMRHFTLAQVSETTRIRQHYLQALENGDISVMPSAAQARGFLKIYAEFLGLDFDVLVTAAAPEPSAAPQSPAEDSADATSPQPSRPGVFEQLRARITRRSPGDTSHSGAEASLEGVTDQDEAAPAPENAVAPGAEIASRPPDAAEIKTKKKRSVNPAAV
jgi:transcriptional regulator with XRE-family HTH domain